MDQLLTANVATNLYWLGRYLERIEASLLCVIQAYDMIIDVDKSAGIKLYKTLGVELSYSNATDFLHEAILGDHHANLYAVACNARENAIICRSHIDTEAFGEIIELQALFECIEKSPADIDYKFIDQVHSLISEIWGALSKREYNKNSDNFFKLGKLVEEADYRIRFNKDEETTRTVIKEIDAIVHQLAPELADHAHSQQQGSLLNIINQQINKIIVE